jgi:hypothetical protein
MIYEDLTTGLACSRWRAFCIYYIKWHAWRTLYCLNVTRLKYNQQNFIFCWLCISIHTRTCNETNLMNYLSSVYSLTTPANGSGLLVAHHQEVMYIYIYTRTSDDAFWLPYSIAFCYSIRPFLDLFHSWLCIFHLSRFFGDGLVFSFLQVPNES